MQCCTQPTTVTGTTYAEFQASLTALQATYGGGWTSVTQLAAQNGVYTQQWAQAFSTWFNPIVYQPRPWYFRGQIAYNRSGSHRLKIGC